MFGISEILQKLSKKKPLTLAEKTKILHSKRVDKEVISYLMKRLAYLHINVLGKSEGSLFDLMNNKALIGWCWQTTESAIVFLNDDDYIERGYLHLDADIPNYYHSWICFNYNDEEYVFDSCLDFVCKKEDYYQLLKPQVVGLVSAQEVKEALISQITTPRKVECSSYEQKAKDYLRALCADFYKEYDKEHKNEVIVSGPEDANAPLYRNGSGYQAVIDKGQIRKLKAHFYYTDC